jgi:FkbH-like protein
VSLEPLVASRYLMVVDLDEDLFFVGHALFGNRRVYDRDTVRFLRVFSEPRTAREAAEEAVRRGIAPRARARSLELFVRQLRAASFVVPAAEDEEALVRARLREVWGGDVARAFGLAAIEDGYEPALPVRLADAAPADAAEEPVSFLLLGWCFAQSLRPVLEEEARRRGLAAAVAVGFPEDLHLVDEVRPDATVLQLSHRKVLAPILDPFYETEPAEMAARIEAASGAIRQAIAEAAARTAGRLLLVQGIAAPQTSPLGALDHRHPIGFFEAVARLDRAAREETARHGHALFVDEEALLSAHGKRRLLDDLVSTYSHHGILAFEPGAPDAHGREATFGIAERTELHRILSRAYLDLYEAWRGRRAVKLIVTDLDGTLWPGEIADDDFSFSSGALTVPLMYGRYGGLHQALKILKSRGILLAVASKNDREDVLRKWQPDRVPLGLGVAPEETRHYLSPEDFAAIEIGWEPKSEQVRRIAASLGVALDAVAFIDDHPVEREEVREMLPAVFVLGDDMNAVREVLLTSPRFQPLSRTEEAARRTETARAAAAREEAARAEPDRAAFLQTLGVRCTVRRERDASRAPRIAELLQRTNQFNTTGRRLSMAEVAELIARPDADVFTLDVSDRFADYGLVGVALVEGARLTCFALSCRAIGLDAETVLLRRALLRCRERAPSASVPFVRTERNLPATRLFLAPGFEPLPEGEGYRFDFGRHEVPRDPAHCTVREE